MKPTSASQDVGNQFGNTEQISESPGSTSTTTSTSAAGRPLSASSNRSSLTRSKPRFMTRFENKTFSDPIFMTTKDPEQLFEEREQRGTFEFLKKAPRSAILRKWSRRPARRIRRRKTRARGRQTKMMVILDPHQLNPRGPLTTNPR